MRKRHSLMSIQCEDKGTASDYLTGHLEYDEHSSTSSISLCSARGEARGCSESLILVVE